MAGRVLGIDAGGTKLLTGVLDDQLGVRHRNVRLWRGTDLAGVSPRAALFTDWAEWPSIPAALLDRGFARHEVAAIMGGNMRRLLDATLG